MNEAKYLKAGQNLWVDRIFSAAVVNSVYSFHASVSAFAEFWNDSFLSMQTSNIRKLSRRQIWHTFVQESVRHVAQASGIMLEQPDAISIENVTRHAFTALGSNGVIRSADKHSCTECTHQYKKTADIITGEDPAAIVGIDENNPVPNLMGVDAGRAVRDAAVAQRNAEDAQDAMDIDQSSDESSDENSAPVKLVVLDGIVMGPTVSLK